MLACLGVPCLRESLQAYVNGVKLDERERGSTLSPEDVIEFEIPPPLPEVPVGRPLILTLPEEKEDLEELTDTMTFLSCTTLSVMHPGGLHYDWKRCLLLHCCPHLKEVTFHSIHINPISLLVNRRVHMKSILKLFRSKVFPSLKRVILDCMDSVNNTHT